MSSPDMAPMSEAARQVVLLESPVPDGGGLQEKKSQVRRSGCWSRGRCVRYVLIGRGGFDGQYRCMVFKLLGRKDIKMAVDQEE